MHDKILQIPDQAWELDVAQQTADITAHLHRLLREGTDRTHRRCKKIYRDDEAWTLKNHKLATRKRIKATNGHLKRQLLQCCFSAWRTLRQPSTGPEEGDSEFCYGVTLRCRLVNLVAQFRAQCSHLKKALIQCKSKLLLQTWEQLPAETPAAHLLKQLRPFFGPTNPKKARQKTIPLLKNAQGEVCQPLRYGLTSSKTWKLDNVCL